MLSTHHMQVALLEDKTQITEPGMRQQSTGNPTDVSAGDRALKHRDAEELSHQVLFLPLKIRIRLRSTCIFPLLVMMMMISHLFQPHHADQMFDHWILSMQALTNWQPRSGHLATWKACIFVAPGINETTPP